MGGWWRPALPPHRCREHPHRGALAIFTHTASLPKGNTMSTVITGASGHLGRLVVDQLLAAGTSPAQVVATGRDAGKLAVLAQNGVTMRRAGFAPPGPPAQG